MKFEEHCAESIRLFGKPYAEVHLFLDQYQGTEPYGMRHRRKLHHEAGIRQVIELFGEAAGQVARQHIISDLKTEGWQEGDPLPKDEEDFKKLDFTDFKFSACR